jgi:CelD/BcsL family acetyltransferase involved in cellulose biosynthesis
VGVGEASKIMTRVLRTQEEIEAVGEDWQRLERHCADPLGYFQSFDWCSSWVRHFAGPARQPYVITLWRDDVLVALWPRMIVEAAGLKRLETLGMPHSQYCGALVRQGSADEGEIARRLQDASKDAGCDVSIARAVPEGTALARLMAGRPSVAEDNVASVLELSQYRSAEDYAQQLGKVQKRNRNRRRNHLARLGDLDFEVIWPGHPDFSDLVRAGAEMKRRWLAETGRYSFGFAMVGYEDFLAGLSGDAEALSGACLSVLRAGDRVVAVELGFIKNRHYYAYIGGFEWDLRDLSPGKVQMEMTVGWLIDAGISGYDLLINPASYKDSWTNRTIVVTTRAEALSWKGRLYTGAWLPTVRPALKRLHAGLPAVADRALSWLRPALCLLLVV